MQKVFDDEVFQKKQNELNIKQIADIKDEEGLKNTYEATCGLDQHYHKLFIAGTRDFPRDRIDD